jgi:hypothetical protein
MTKKEKIIKLDIIKNLITAAKFKLDSYGNYKRSLDGTEYRIKLKAINIRIERKLPGNTVWRKVISEPIVTVDLMELIKWFEKFSNK